MRVSRPQKREAKRSNDTPPGGAGAEARPAPEGVRADRLGCLRGLKPGSYFLRLRAVFNRPDALEATLFDLF